MLAPLCSNVQGGFLFLIMYDLKNIFGEPKDVGHVRRGVFSFLNKRYLKKTNKKKMKIACQKIVFKYATYANIESDDIDFVCVEINQNFNSFYLWCKQNL